MQPPQNCLQHKVHRTRICGRLAAARMFIGWPTSVQELVRPHLCCCRFRLRQLCIPMDAQIALHSDKPEHSENSDGDDGRFCMDTAWGNNCKSHILSPATHSTSHRKLPCAVRRNWVFAFLTMLGLTRPCETLSVLHLS